MAIRLLLLLFLGTVWQSEGNAFEIYRRDSEVFVKSKDCSEVTELSNAISGWKKKTDNLICSLSSFQENDFCISEISDCLPDKIKNYFAKNSSEGGPNCFNAGLVYSGILSSLRYSSADEISFYMNSGLCKKVDSSEKPTVGDLGLISMAGLDQPHSFQHAFIYLSENFVYEKPTQNRESPFTISKKRNTLSSYGLSQNETQDASSSYKGIDRKVTYYRCISTKEYLEGSTNLPPILTNLWNEMSSAEKCFEEFTMTNAPLSYKARNDILNIAKALTHYLSAERNRSEGNNQEKVQFILASLQLKLKSILDNFPPKRVIKKVDQNLIKFSDDLKKSLLEF